jgi:hypothetical protein
VSGNWQVTAYSNNATFEQVYWVIKLDTKGGKTTAELVAAMPAYKDGELASFNVKDQHVRAVFKVRNSEYVFEGTISKDGKKIAGTYGTGGGAAPVFLVPTELTTLDNKNMIHRLDIEQMDKAATLLAKGPALRAQAQRAKDPDEKAKLLKEARDADAAAIEQAPKLYGEVLDKHARTFAAGRAAVLLLQMKTAKATDDDCSQWAATAVQSAREFGPAWELQVCLEVARALADRTGQAERAVQYARKADALLTDTSPVQQQVKVLQVLAYTLGAANETAELKKLEERIDRIETFLDKEYLAKTPPLKVEPFAGRKGKSDRVVVMELFTGSECPPCIAADVAFEALGKAYRPSDLVLIQYHMHIPGPDPMTNSDCESRWKYYREAFGAKEVIGTPTSIFCGVPKAQGGGARAGAEKKCNAYREIIDTLLETDATCKISATARRAGDKLQVTANVSQLVNPGKDVKLRLVLVEEHVRFPGGNGLRFHHQVVRAMPGGAEGVSVTKETLTAKHEVDLGDLRKQLNTYLDDYAANVRPFPRLGRPLDLGHLRLIAFVQDDATHEVLQAVQVEVKE